MRTTFTLDPDVDRLLAEEVRRVRRPFNEVVNDAIRRGLASRRADVPPRPYRTSPHKARLRTGIDRGALNRLADQLEDEAVRVKAAPRT